MTSARRAAGTPNGRTGRTQRHTRTIPTPAASVKTATISPSPPPPSSSRPLLLNTDEACEVLRISRSSLQRLLREGSLPAIRFGLRRRLIPAAAIEQLVASAGGLATATRAEAEAVATVSGPPTRGGTAS